MTRLIADLLKLRQHHEFTRDRIGQPGCAVRTQAAEYVEVIDRAIAEIRSSDETIERCATSAEAFDDPSRDWLARSVWDEIKRDTATRIRALKTGESA